MAARKKKSSGRGKKNDKRFVLTFGWSGLISTLVLAIIVLVWAFIFGVLIGRGYRPESVIPSLSRVVPSQEKASVRNPRRDRDILKPKELGFLDALTKGENATAAVPAGSGEAEEQGEQNQQEETQPEQRRHRYRYQVAALQSSERAAKVVQELEEKGMDAVSREVDKDGVTWYRIHVLFKGSSEEAKQFKQRLAENGPGTPFLREKTRLE